MNILKVVGDPDEAFEAAFSTTKDSLTLGLQHQPFEAVSENSLPDVLLQKVCTEPACVVLCGSRGKLSSLREIFAAYVQLDSTVFVSACEVKRDGIVDLLHISNVKTFVQTIPLERQLKKVKLSEAIVRLVSKRHSNSSYGILSCLVVNLHAHGMLTSIIDINARLFCETFSRGTVLPMVEKLIFKPSNRHFVLHVDKAADSRTVAASLQELHDTQSLFVKKHTLITSNLPSAAPRVVKTALPGYARPTIASRRPAKRVLSTKLAGKSVGKPYDVRSISRDATQDDALKQAKEDLMRAKDDLDHTKDVLNHTKDDLSQTKETLIQTKDALTQTKDDFVQKVSGLKQSVSQLKNGAVQEINAELVFTRQNLNEVMLKFISQGNTISDLESTVADQNAKLDRLNHSYEQKCQELSEAGDWKHHLDSTQSLLKESRSSFDSLQSKHHALEQSYKDALQKLQALEQSAEGHSTLTTQVEALQHTNSIQEKNLSKLTSILEDKEMLIVELRGLQKTNENLEALKVKAEKDLAEHQKHAERKLEELQAVGEKYRQDLEDSRRTTKEYQVQMDAQRSKCNEQQEIINAQQAKEAKYETKIAELNEIISKAASFDYPELDFTKVNYPLTNSPVMDFGNEFEDENTRAFKKPPASASSPLRVSNEINISNRFDAVGSKKVGKESSFRASFPKTFTEDVTLH